MCFSEIREKLDALMLVYGCYLCNVSGYDLESSARYEMIAIAHAARMLGVLSADDFSRIVKVIWNKEAFRRVAEKTIYPRG